MARKRDAADAETETEVDAVSVGLVDDGDAATPDPTRKKAAVAPASSSLDAIAEAADLNQSPVSMDALDGCANVYYWSGCHDAETIRQHNAIRDEEAARMPFVGCKEPLSALAAEYEIGSPILLNKIKLLGEQYAALRRTRGDGNCFFRAFMFSYLECILERQDKVEVDRIKVNVEKCRKTLRGLGYADFTFEDFFSVFLDQLEFVLQGKEGYACNEELLARSRDQSISDYIVMFFRFVTSGEIRRRADFFEPFIVGLTNCSVDQFCKASVEPMGEESDHVHITALSDALGVPIRVVYLDRSNCDSGPAVVNHHDFAPSSDHDVEASIEDNCQMLKPFLTLLYRPGHYDILYPN